MDAISNIKIRLDEVNNNCIENYGLYQGKTGLCICYFLLAKLTADETCLTKAHIILDELSGNIANVENLYFANGLAGIGWGIEWLVQNGYVNTNTDEILEDLDDELYKSVVYSKSLDISLANGTLGKAMFFYRRLIAQNPNSVRYRNICNQECMVVLTDELNNTLCNEDTGIIRKISYQDIGQVDKISIAETLMFLPKVYLLKINFEVVKKLICVITSFIENYFGESKKHSMREIDSSDQYLLYAYYQAGLSLKDESWVAKSKAIYSTIALNGCFHLKNGLAFDIYLHKKLESLIDTNQTVSFCNEKAITGDMIFDVLFNIEEILADGSWEEAFLLK